MTLIWIIGLRHQKQETNYLKGRDNSTLQVSAWGFSVVRIEKKEWEGLEGQLLSKFIKQLKSERKEKKIIRQIINFIFKNCRLNFISEGKYKYTVDFWNKKLSLFYKWMYYDVFSKVKESVGELL